MLLFDPFVQLSCCPIVRLSMQSRFRDWIVFFFFWYDCQALLFADSL